MKTIVDFIMESNSNSNNELVNIAKDLLSDEYEVNPAKGKIQGIKIDIKNDETYHYTISFSEDRKLWFIRRYNTRAMYYLATVIGWDKKSGTMDKAGFENFEDAVNKFIEYIEDRKNKKTRKISYKY